MLKQRIANHQILLSCLLLVVAVLAIYGQTWGFGFVDWDDNKYVRDHPQVLQGLTMHTFWWTLGALDMANWHPLTWWSYLLDVTLFGPSAAVLHLENAFWHALNSLLLYLFFLRVTTRQWPSLMLAMVFAIHPLHVESVAWIAERKDVLSTFFLLAAVWQYWRYVGERRRGYFWLSVLLAALGMMAKPMLVTVPLLLLILDYWPFERLALQSQAAAWRENLKLLLARCWEKWPFFALAAADAWLTLVAQSGGGAMRMLGAVPLVQRLVNALASYCDYLRLTLLPTDLSFMYVYRPRGLGELLLALAVLGALTLFAWRRRGAVLAGWLWFLVALLPVIGLLQVGDQMRADRYMYVPMIGLAMMVCFGWHSMRARVWSGLPMFVRYGLPVLLLVFAILAGVQTTTWRNPDTLLQHALRQDPDNYIAHTLLAQRYSQLGQRELALQHADLAIGLKPRSPAAAVAANAAAVLLLRQRDYALAQSYLQAALRADLANPDSYYNLGEIALRDGRYAEAVRYYAQAVELRPDYSAAYNNLGIAHRLNGDLVSAVAAFEKAVALDPHNTVAARNLLADRARLSARPAEVGH